MSYQHQAARNNTAPWSDPHTLPPISEGAIHSAMDRGHLKPRLTRAFLRKQTDWMDWATSEFKQLNQYHAQNMFGHPTYAPPKANIFPLIWTYLIKTDRTKKARYVCSGSPHRKGTVTLDHSYAVALDHSSVHTFGLLQHCTIMLHMALMLQMHLLRHLLPKHPSMSPLMMHSKVDGKKF